MSISWNHFNNAGPVGGQSLDEEILVNGMAQMFFNVFTHMDKRFVYVRNKAAPKYTADNFNNTKSIKIGFETQL